MEGAVGWLATVECMANDVRNRGVEPKFLVVGEHDYMMARFAAAELMGTPERPLDPTEILGLQIVKVYEGRAHIGW